MRPGSHVSIKNGIEYLALLFVFDKKLCSSSLIQAPPPGYLSL